MNSSFSVITLFVNIMELNGKEVTKWNQLCECEQKWRIKLMNKIIWFYHLG